MVGASSRGSVMTEARSGTPSAKVRGRAASGDSNCASRPHGGARLALKRRGDIEVLGAAATMGKSWTIGHRGLYLKGKGVMRGWEFVLNLILNRIKDLLKIC
jgi:hypothetical protein